MAVRAWKAGALFADSGETGAATALPALDDDLAAEADAWGIPRELVARQAGRSVQAVADAFEGLFPGHVIPMRAFLAAASQWRTGFTGLRMIVTGLDYRAAQVAWEALGIDLTPDEFSCFRKIESEAVAALNGGDA